MDSTRTVPAAPVEAVRNARADLIDQLTTAYKQIEATARDLHQADYADPSKLGADRARLNYAERLINEVTCTIADLIFARRPENEGD